MVVEDKVEVSRTRRGPVLCEWQDSEVELTEGLDVENGYLAFACGPLLLRHTIQSSLKPALISSAILLRHSTSMTTHAHDRTFQQYS